MTSPERMCFRFRFSFGILDRKRKIKNPPLSLGRPSPPRRTGNGPGVRDHCDFLERDIGYDGHDFESDGSRIDLVAKFEPVRYENKPLVGPFDGKLCKSRTHEAGFWGETGVVLGFLEEKIGRKSL